MAGLFNLIGGAGSIAAGYDIAKDIRETGAQGAADMSALGNQLAGDAAFKGYGVQTGLGNTTVGADGSTNLGVGQDAGMLALQEQMLGQGQQFGDYAGQAAGNAMMDTGAREQSVYERAMAMQQPGLDAQRAQQQAREYAMGRGGVRGSQFGGTAEDAAMARAQAQAQNQAAFQSMGQAQQEMMNQGALASQFGQLGQGYAGQGMGAFGQSFTPIQQQLNALQVGQGNAGMAQTGQLTGAGYNAQLGLGGLQSQINADMAGSQLYADLFGAGMNSISGLGKAGEGFFDTVKEWF
tara:strand:- start:13412 stop:14293 length:882 start_codon:yes stop_codon:yes gene_type:complete